MGFADNTFNITMLDTTLTEIFDKDKRKAQFTRLGDTSRWFPQRSRVLAGSRYIFWAFTTPSTGTRRSDFSTAETGTFPVASQPSYTKLSYGLTNLVVFWTTVKFNQLAQMQSEDLETSLWEAANKLVLDATTDFSSQMNLAIHQDTACTMATVGTKYKSDGDTYATATTAFIKITDAGVRQFLKGQQIIFDNTEVCTVNDIIVGPDGPWRSATRIAGVGPGIVVTWVSGGSSNCDGITAADEIRLYGEAAGDNFAGLPSWFSGTTDVYYDKDGNALDRDALGNAWQIPEIFDYTSEGDPVTFDIETHFRDLAEVMPMRVNAGRRGREGLGAIQSENEGINIPAALVGITTVGIANEAINTAADTHRFTMEAATSMDAATKRQLFGDVGFDGVVYRSPTLPPIAIQADAAARAHKMTIIDPQSWFWLRMKGAKMEWLDNGGSRWVRVLNPSLDNRLTYVQQAGAWTSALLACDQPGAQVEIQGIKSSTEE